MKRFLKFYLVVALATVAAHAAELTDADAVLEFAVAKQASYESYTATLTQSMTMPAMQMTGTLAFKRPAQMQMQMNGALPMLIVFGSDHIFWQEMIKGGVTNVMKMDLENVPANNPAVAMMKESLTRMDPQAQLVKAKERCAFTLLPPTELQGQRMYVLVGETRADAKLSPQEAAMAAKFGNHKLLIGQQDGFLHRFEIFDKAGSNAVITLDIANLKFNTPLAEELFIYKPAPGVHVIDMSQALLQMMNRPPAGK